MAGPSKHGDAKKQNVNDIQEEKLWQCLRL
jgi:hypothetical protein